MDESGALLLAAHRQDARVVRALIKMGADVNVRGVMRMTCLQLCHDDPRIVEVHASNLAECFNLSDHKLHSQE